jgi:hypothetical protein
MRRDGRRNACGNSAGRVAPYRRELLRNLSLNKICTRCLLRCVSVGRQVICADEQGGEKAFDADTVIVAAGMKGYSDEALKYYGFRRAPMWSATATGRQCAGGDQKLPLRGLQI